MRHAVQVRILSDQGIKEVTLLGQNVNSYADTSALEDQSNKKSTDPDADPFAIYAQVKLTNCALMRQLLAPPEDRTNSITG